jgi:hypothetical protein
MYRDRCLKAVPRHPENFESADEREIIEYMSKAVYDTP